MTKSNSIHTTEASRARLKKRYTSEARFKGMGIAAVIVAALFLVILLSSIVRSAWPALYHHHVLLETRFDSSSVDSQKNQTEASFRAGDYDTVVKNALRSVFSWVTTRQERRDLNGLISSGSPQVARSEFLKNPSVLDQQKLLSYPLSANADLYLKGRGVKRQIMSLQESLEVSVKGEGAAITLPPSAVAHLSKAIHDNLKKERAEKQHQLASQQRLQATNLNETERVALDEKLKSIKTGLEALDQRLASTHLQVILSETYPTLMLSTSKGVFKLTRIDGSMAEAQILVPQLADQPLEQGATSEKGAGGATGVLMVLEPQAQRKLKDTEIAWLDYLKGAGRIQEKFNTTFFTKGASREPEQAGVWGAILGTCLTLLVTVLVSFPIGVAAAIYLEEFAPKNRWTNLIEVNINNLAAVPSIVFGLLGLAVFLNFFSLPRSAPLVGGLVMALMSLPVIIIAARVSLRAVPPSIRSAALGIGASKQQAVFHHVLPLALPGIMTGTILSMARALGETAPLLMIGMVAFIVDIPKSFFDAATVLPVQIYMWADFPEVAFEQRTALAILVLLAFLVLMNATAVIIRKKFERRW